MKVYGLGRQTQAWNYRLTALGAGFKAYCSMWQMPAADTCRLLKSLCASTIHGSSLCQLAFWLLALDVGTLRDTPSPHPSCQCRIFGSCLEPSSGCGLQSLLASASGSLNSGHCLFVFYWPYCICHLCPGRPQSQPLSRLLICMVLLTRPDYWGQQSQAGKKKHSTETFFGVECCNI